MADMLKACPFCGFAAKLCSHEMDKKTTLWWVQCRNTYCLARPIAKDTKAAALAAWNDRKETAWTET